MGGAGTNTETGTTFSAIPYVKPSSSGSREKEGEKFYKNFVKNVPRGGGILVKSQRLSDTFLAEKVEGAINHHHCQ